MAELLILFVIIVLSSYFAILWAFRTRLKDAQFAFVALLFVPYWTIAGALSTLAGKLDDVAAVGNYLEKFLFVIRADGDYLLALLSYAIFMFLILAFVLTLAPRVSRAHPLNRELWQELAVSFPHVVLLILLLPLIVVAVVIVLRSQVQAGEVSLYLSKYYDLPRHFDYINRGSTGALAVGATLLLAAGRRRRQSGHILTVGYVAEFAAVLWINFATGSRGFLIACVLAVAVGTAWLGGDGFIRRNWRAALSVAILTPVLLLLASVPGVTRNRYLGNSVAEQFERFFEGLSDTPKLMQSWLGSGEQYAAHASLYGVISRDAQWPSLEYSFPYSQYASLVEAPTDQGFTIHQVAAWWLYIGPLAPVAAATVFAICLLLLLRISRASPISTYASFAASAAMLSALGLPIALLRGGPESAWGLALTVVLLPGALLYLPMRMASRRVRDANRATSSRRRAPLSLDSGRVP